MVDISDLKQVVDIFKQNDLSSLIYQLGESKIELARSNDDKEINRSRDEPAVEKRQGHTDMVISTDLVGVISFDERDIVVGRSVKKGEKLGYIDVMKMENDIISPITGIISEVCVSNLAVVQAGDDLFKVSKNEKN